MKAVIYARVSSKDQEETGYSLPAQEKFLKDYTGKKGFEVSKVFAISESASGKKQREVFGQMIEYVTKQGIKIIICEKVDRLTRNFKDAVSIDEWLEEDLDRQVHLVKDSLILHKNSKSQEKLNWGIRILFAKNYIDNLSEEVKKGLGEKLRQGWLPTKPPLGYKTIGEKGRKTHIINEQTAPMVRNMFELYATGNYSTKTIVDVLHEAGMRSSTGGKVYKSRVAQLLSDPFYIGKIRYNNMIYAGAHEPLIIEDLFDAVQVKLKGNSIPRYRKHLPLFKALITCAECGGSVTWEIQKGHWYGHCNKYRNCTQKKFVRQEKVEEQLLPYFEKIGLKNERLIGWIKKALSDSHTDEFSFSTSVRSNLNSRYQIVQKRLEAIYDDKIDGKITEDFYQKKFEQYTLEKDQVLKELKNIDNAGNKYYELGSSLIDLANRAKEIYMHPKRTVKDKRLLMNLMFSSLKLKDGELTITYSKAFEILSKFAPAWKKFEHKQEPLQNEKLSSSANITEILPAQKPSEPQKKIRTAKNTDVPTQFGLSIPKSQLLLRGQGSNLGHPP